MATFVIPDGTSVINGAVAPYDAVQAGDILELQTTRSDYIELRNLQGNSRDDPIYVRNESGGQVVIDDPSAASAIHVRNSCQFLRITGTGAAGVTYGLSLTGSTNYGLRISHAAQGIEADHFEVAGDGSANPDIAVSIWTVNGQEGAVGSDRFSGFWIHDFYIHDVDDEATYIGSADLNDPWTDDVELYDGLIEDVGWDGIQLRHGDNLVAHDIVINRAAADNQPGQRSAARFGNWTTNGVMYNLWIEESGYNGVVTNHLGGYGPVEFYNIIILRAGQAATCDGAFLVQVGDDIEAYNITIIDTDGDGVADNNPAADHAFRNIISVGSTASDFNIGVSTESNNQSGAAAAQNFVDYAGDDFHLTETSPARNAGTTLLYSLTDYDGTARPQGASPDIGAYEYIEESEPTPITGAVASSVPFFVLGSPRFQARILPIVVKEPIWVSDNLISDDLGFYAEGLEIVWAAFGGYWSAKFGLTGRQSQIEEWLEEGLGRDITIYNPSLSVIFEGFVNSVSANIGSLSLTRGPFLDIGNRVKLAYSTVDTSVTPPAVGIRTSTDWSGDTTSQGKYGTRERVISVGGISAANADLVRDTALNELKDPETDEQHNLESGGVPSVSIDIAGYVQLLETYVYNTTTTGTANINAKIQAVLAADPNSTFSTDYTQLETVTTQVGSYEQDDRSAMSIIKGLVALGNASSERTLFGVYDNRRARYETVPSDTYYQRSLRRSEQALETYGAGQRVLPWNVRPGRWVFFTDLFPGKTLPSERRLDPRFSLIEQATYNAPWGLSLKGGKVNRLDQLMARLGLGGAT